MLICRRFPCKSPAFSYLCTALVCNPPTGKQLKGNQVRILNSPAAVSFVKCDRHTDLFSHWIDVREGACRRNESEDLPCTILYHCFRGKSVEFEEPDNHLPSKTSHSD